MGVRMAPKYLVQRMMGIVRSALLEAVQGLADQGLLTREDDVFYLHIDELGTLAAAEARDWRGLVAERRAADSREARRRQVPQTEAAVYFCTTLRGQIWGTGCLSEREESALDG